MSETMLENRKKDYGDWDLRTLKVAPFLKAVPLCMLLSLPIGIWLTNNILLWLLIGALVGVVVACELIAEENYLNQNIVQPKQVSLEGGADA